MGPITPSKAISKKQIHCLEVLGKTNLSETFYLAGGTALALSFKHRKSVDLDFFSFVKFNNDKLIEQLFSVLKPKPSVISVSEGSLYILYKRVQISFIYYPYRLIDKKIDGGFNIDIAG